MQGKDLMKYKDNCNEFVYSIFILYKYRVNKKQF